MASISKKTMLAFLRREAAKLPTEFYETRHLEEVEIEGIKTYKYVMVKHPVNHTRRLHRLWKQTRNFYLVGQYFNARGMVITDGSEPINEDDTVNGGNASQ